MRFFAAALVLLAGAAAFASCGGNGDDDFDVVPTLAGTPIPTAAIEPSPTPVCDVAAPLPVPANFPADVRLPPDYKIASIETAPHLKVVGRATPPQPKKGTVASELAVSMQDALRSRGWALTLNPRTAGQDYTLTAPDGRTGHFNVQIVPGCPAHAELLVELFWITP